MYSFFELYPLKIANGQADSHSHSLVYYDTVWKQLNFAILKFNTQVSRNLENTLQQPPKNLLSVSWNIA